ncbi:MAG: hypothetical protein ACE1Z6_13870 [Candidatus Methylomirabilales bacterium]|nr:hypothetical protein [candidate division NC10 bacterium]
MGFKTKIIWQGREVPAEELDFEPLRESWNEYRLEDGTMLKIKTVVAKITRLDAYTNEGDPIYNVTSSNVVTAQVQPSMKKKAP